MEEPAKSVRFIDKYKFPKGAALLIIYQLFGGMAYYVFFLVYPIYMTSIVRLSDETSTAIYHARSVIAFCTNIVGAIIADGYLGRIRTYLLIYPFDILLFAIAVICAIFEKYYVLITLVLFTAILGGLVAPGMRAFVADQIPATNKVMLSTFLHMIYLINNFGVIIVGFLGPIMHKDVYCFGRECYPLNFGVAVVMMMSAFGIIVLGLLLKWFILHPSTKNIITDTVACIFFGIKSRFKKGKHPTGHWMDYAESKYDYKFVHDCKIVLGLCFFLLAHPIFFTVFEQMTSIWTLQARYMDGMVTDTFILKADQIQTLNPILVVILIPIFELTVYPFFDKIRFAVPYRITLGQFFTAGACIFMMYIQYMINYAVLNKLEKNEVHVNFVNLNPFPVTIENNMTLVPIDRFNSGKIFIKLENPIITIIINTTRYTTRVDKFGGKYITGTISFDSSLQMNNTYSEIVFQEDGGYSKVRLIDTDALPDDVDVLLVGKVGINKEFIIPKTKNAFGVYVKCAIGVFDVYLKSASSKTKMVTILVKPAETLLIYTVKSNGTIELHVSKEYIVNLPKIYWQFLPYLFVTIGEVFFNVNTGIFMYGEAPITMKSVMLSIQYLCIAIGDIYILILNEIFKDINKIYFFILCAILVFVSGICTAILGMIFLRDKAARELNIAGRENN